MESQGFFDSVSTLMLSIENVVNVRVPDCLLPVTLASLRYYARMNDVVIHINLNT